MGFSNWPTTWHSRLKIVWVGAWQPIRDSRRLWAWRTRFKTWSKQETTKPTQLKQPRFRLKLIWRFPSSKPDFNQRSAITRLIDWWLKWGNAMQEITFKDHRGWHTYRYSGRTAYGWPEVVLFKCEGEWINCPNVNVHMRIAKFGFRKTPCFTDSVKRTES